MVGPSSGYTELLRILHNESGKFGIFIQLRSLLQHKLMVYKQLAWPNAAKCSLEVILSTKCVTLSCPICADIRAHRALLALMLTVAAALTNQGTCETEAWLLDVFQYKWGQTAPCSLHASLLPSLPETSYPETGQSKQTAAHKQLTISNMYRLFTGQLLTTNTSTKKYMFICR